jgi:hypothetical protein
MIWFPEAKEEFPSFEEALGALAQRKRDGRWFVAKMGLVSLRTEMEVRVTWALLTVLGATTRATALGADVPTSGLHPDDCAYAVSSVLETAYAFGMNATPQSPDTPLLFADVPELTRNFQAGVSFRAEMDEMERCTSCNDPEAQACPFHQ